jgi:hypothetical protein
MFFNVSNSLPPKEPKRKIILHWIINLYLDVRAGIIAFIRKWRSTLHVSPLTRFICNKMILDAVKRTNALPKSKLIRRLTKHRWKEPAVCALYNLARKEAPRMWDESLGLLGEVGEGDKKTFNTFKPITIGGEESYISMPPGWGHLNPWPDGMTRCTVEAQSKLITKRFDDVIVNLIVGHTKAEERITFKKCMTAQILEQATSRLYFEDLANGPIFHDSDGLYYICVTSRSRVETQAFTRDGGGWEDEMIYQDYIDRPLYPGEYGRLKIVDCGKDSVYIVFLTTLDDRMQFALLFGPDALTVTPLKKNLRVMFRRTAKGEEGEQPRGFDVGFLFQLGAVGDKSKCVVLEATKRVGGQE